jgi:hypothetical protein
MRPIVFAAPFAALAISTAGWHGCQPTGKSPTPVSSIVGAADSKGACGLTVLYQNNADGEIEPCG